MKKVKEMKTCMSTGKVCFRVRDSYNQLSQVTSSINAVEAGEQGGTVTSEVLHQSMTAIKSELSQYIHETCLTCEVQAAKKAVEKAERDYLMTVRASQEPYDAVWLNIGTMVSGIKLNYTALCDQWREACAVDDDCIAASKAIKSAIEVRNAAREVLSDRKELLDRLYSSKYPNI